MKTSLEGVEFIKSFEAFSASPYVCPTGRPTVGYGHVIAQGEDFHKPLTQEEAEDLLYYDLDYYERAVNELVKVPLTQQQFDALVSFCYNVGPDIDDDNIAEGLGDSTLLRKLNQGNYSGAAREFLKWDKGTINGVRRTLAGLTRRRKAEKRIFEEGVYHE